MKSAPVLCETARPTVSAITLGESRRRSFFGRVSRGEIRTGGKRLRDLFSRRRCVFSPRERRKDYLRGGKVVRFSGACRPRYFKNAAFREVFGLRSLARLRFPGLLRPSEAAPDDVERPTSIVQGLSVASLTNSSKSYKRHSKERERRFGAIGGAIW